MYPIENNRFLTVFRYQTFSIILSDLHTPFSFSDRPEFVFQNKNSENLATEVWYGVYTVFVPLQ